MGKLARLGTVLLVFWAAFVVYRSADDHELFGLELDRWDDDAFLVNLLALPAAIAAFAFSIRWALESGVALRDMNWKRGLKRLWLLAAVPWVVYVVGEFDVAENVGYAWRYYTDQNGLANELHSPTAVAECVAANLALGAKYDRLMDNSDLIERFRREDADAGGEGILENMREKSAAAELDSWLQREEARKKKEIEEAKASEREAIATCSSRIPEAPDLRWIIPVLIAPTFGVAFTAFAVWLIFITLRWAWRGFYS